MEKVQHFSGGTMEKHSVKMSVACMGSGGKTTQTVKSVDGCRPKLCMFTVCYVSEHTPVAQVWLHGMHLFTVFLCFLEWVSVFVYGRAAKCRNGWEYKLGQHIKSGVSCWSGFTRGTAHSLNFPAFQLVYSGTCQASPPFEKPSPCR